MNEKRRALGRGLGALIPSSPGTSDRPRDVFFGDAHADPEGSMHFGVDQATHQGATHQGALHQGALHQGALHQGAASAEGPGLAPVPGARFAEIPVTAIRPNPKQPREYFDEDQLAELAESVRQIGILQPVVVRPLAPGAPVGSGSPGSSDSPAGGSPASSEASEAGATEGAGAGVEPGEAHPGHHYELVMGERRWRAAQSAGLEVIPAIIRDTADDALLRDALLENLHRSALNPLEEAAAYQQLLDDFGCTQEELSARIGRSRPQISNTIRLLKLPPVVARRVAAGVLSAGHARALLGLSDGAAMERLAQRIVAEGLSVRTVEEIVALGVAEPKSPRSRRPVERPARLDDVAARLADRLDTRVHVDLGRRRGRLTVEFATLDDLDRIAALLGIDAEGHHSGESARPWGA